MFNGAHVLCIGDTENQNETPADDKEEEEEVSQPCSEANTEKDGYVDGRCICKDGFSGAFCEATDTCKSGEARVYTDFHEFEMMCTFHINSLHYERQLSHPTICT